MIATALSTLLVMRTGHRCGGAASLWAASVEDEEVKSLAAVRSVPLVDPDGVGG